VASVTSDEAQPHVEDQLSPVDVDVSDLDLCPAIWLPAASLPAILGHQFAGNVRWRVDVAGEATKVR
jgi:hypothetical protein